jgi:hypothetical protein
MADETDPPQSLPKKLRDFLEEESVPELDPAAPKRAAPLPRGREGQPGEGSHTLGDHQSMMYLMLGSP